MDVPHERVPEPSGADILAAAQLGQRGTGPIDVVQRNVENLPAKNPTGIVSDLSDAELLASMGTDAALWASGFIEKNPQVKIDEGALIGWFASAIESGKQEAYQNGYRRGKRPRTQG